MKNATKSLKQLLSSGQFLIADLYTFTLTSRQQLRFTSYDVPLTYNGEVYQPALLTRTMTSQKAGLMVDEMNITCNFSKEDTLGGVPLLQAFVAGTFDNAYLTLERVFMPPERPTDTNAGAIYMFSGRVDIESAGRTTVELVIKSISELFNVKLPRNLWTPTCQHTIYDQNCALNRAKYTYSGKIVLGSSRSKLITDLTTLDTGWCDYGVLTMTTGRNSNVRISVKKQSANIFYPTRSLPYEPAVNDAFTVSAGCDKFIYTCRCKFNNMSNFRGFPFIPRPESLT